MLIALSIRDFVLIERLDLDLDTGFNAVTGETGAGKSIVLSAIGFALGERADRNVIRHGAGATQVTAGFMVSAEHPARVLLQENGLDGDPEEAIVLRRRLGRTGAARGWINDAPVSAGLMRQIAGLLMEINGQHAALSLKDTATQRRMLDDYAQVTPQLTACQAAWTDWRDARDALAELEQRLKKASS